jgi:hypothetical protein
MGLRRIFFVRGRGVATKSRDLCTGVYRSLVQDDCHGDVIKDAFHDLYDTGISLPSGAFIVVC